MASRTRIDIDDLLADQLTPVAKALDLNLKTLVNKLIYNAFNEGNQITISGNDDAENVFVCESDLQLANLQLFSKSVNQTEPKQVEAKSPAQVEPVVDEEQQNLFQEENNNNDDLELV